MSPEPRAPSKIFGLAAVLVCACTPETQLPGDEPMGSYSFEAIPLELDCRLTDIAEGGFTFTGAFSRDSESGAAWFRLNNILREAQFDGQVITSSYAAPRVFNDALCKGCSTELQESFALAILSKSQNDASGGSCPEGALDGGIPSGGGITGPGKVGPSFDAVRACGEWVNEVLATPLDGESCDPGCGLCRLRYTVVGARK